MAMFVDVCPECTCGAVLCGYLVRSSSGFQFADFKGCRIQFYFWALKHIGKDNIFGF
jgi:hypothetical protein